MVVTAGQLLLDSWLYNIHIRSFHLLYIGFSRSPVSPTNSCLRHHSYFFYCSLSIGYNVLILQVLTNRRVKERVEQRCEVWGRNITSQTNVDRALAEIRYA
jgi:hypothetical protein